VNTKIAGFSSHRNILLLLLLLLLLLFRGQSPACHHGDPDSKPGQFMYDLRWAKWRCDRFLFMYCSFVLSVSFHQSSVHVIPSYTGDAVIKLTVEGFLFRSHSFSVHRLSRY